LPLPHVKRKACVIRSGDSRKELATGLDPWDRSR